MKRYFSAFRTLLAALSVLLLLVAAIPAALGADVPGLRGRGTEQDPWMIYSAEDLQTAYTYIAQQCDELPDGRPGAAGYFRLGADIALEQPIKIYNNRDYDLRIGFCGTFDGGGHAIRNFALNLHPNPDWGTAKVHRYPLFPVNFGTIENLTLELSQDYGSLYSDDHGIITGGLVCDNYGTIRNCRVEGNLGGSGLRDPVGLVAGLNGNGGKIIDCSASGKITMSGDRYYASSRLAGGIVGQCDAGTWTYLAPGDLAWSSSNGIVTNNAGLDGLDPPLVQGCTADVTILGNWCIGLGGITGKTDRYTVVENCAANVTLTAGGVETYNSVGGLVGDSAGTLRDCFASGQITLKSTAGKTPSAVGGLLGTAQEGALMTGCTSTVRTTVSDLNAYHGALVGRDKGAVLSDNSAQNSQGTVKPDEITVTVNGRLVRFDQPPIAERNRVLVPVRAIFEAMGAEVTWNQATMTAYAVRGQDTVAIQIGNDTMYRNQTPVALDVPAKALNGRTLVPVRAVSEAFHADVQWDAAQNRVVILISGSTQTPSEAGTGGGQGGVDQLPNCILCGNTGMRTCNFCRGEGTIVDPYYNPLKDGINYIRCPYCQGMGKVPCFCGH